MPKGIQIKCGWFKMITIVKIWLYCKKTTISTCLGCCPLLMSYFLETVKKMSKQLAHLGKVFKKKQNVIKKMYTLNSQEYLHTISTRPLGNLQKTLSLTLWILLKKSVSWAIRFISVIFWCGSSLHVFSSIFVLATM